MRITNYHIALVLACWFGMPQAIAQKEKAFTDPRDNKVYEVIRIDGLEWFAENLRYPTPTSISVKHVFQNNEGVCGEFYPLDEAFKACPAHWRLPTEKEVKALLKKERKGELVVVDTLNVVLCGRIDNGKHAKAGLQNTFWMNAEIKDGSISHWHVFQSTHKLHEHNVVVAQRQFPVRCVR